ncbi:universal stress protein, partial [Halorubrum sp. Eb13]|uniref:universal stress protein n=2 Tax=Halorubrum TaxID=56688 RepID=UPI000B991B89
AASLAERYDATVHVVSAVDTLAQTLGGPQAGAFAERIEDAARKRVETVTAELDDAGVDVVGDVRQGEPIDIIEAAIEDTGADIVVMPSHTRSGLRRVLLGSVTEKIVRVSSVPVVTVPMAVDGDDATTGEDATTGDADGGDDRSADGT